MPRAATAIVEFQGDFSQIQRQAKTQTKGLESSFGATFKNIAKAAAISFAAVGVGKFVKSAFAEAEQAQKVGKQTDAVIKSTGASANVTAKEVQTLGKALERKSAVDDEVVKSGENVLLTFRNVKNEVGKGNDIFNQATEAALNMSATLGTDLQSSVLQLGKALNDPVKGLTRLQRAGVSFTGAQIKLIKSLAAQGDLLGAQKVILKELSLEFGGAAAAAATPSERLKVAVGNLQEALGTILVPLVAKASVALAGLAEWVDRNHGLALALALAVTTLGTAFLGMLIVAKVINVIKAFQLAMVELNTTFLANPIVLVIAALVALGVGIFIAYKKIKPFHDAIDALWQLLQATFRWVQHNWPLLLAILTGPFGLAVRAIIQHWSGILSFFKGIPAAIGGFLKNVATVVTAPFRTAFNAIARLWNNTVGKLSFKIPSWVPGIGGKGFSVPDIPTFATGGMVPGSGPVLSLLHGGEGVFTPGQMNALGGSGGIDARIIVQGHVIDFDQLNSFADERDRKLTMAIAVGHR